MNIVFDLKEGESLISYVLRLLYTNYYGNIDGFAKDWEASRADIRNNLFHKRALETISSWTGKSVDELERRSSNAWKRKYGSVFIQKAMVRNSTKYCVSCVKEKGLYHQSLWNFEPVTLCLEHKELLTHCCFQCQKKITIDTFLIGKCPHCGERFSSAKGQLISDTLSLQAQAWMQSLIGTGKTDSEKTPILQGIQFNDYLTLTDRMYHFLQGCPSILDSRYTLQAFKSIKQFQHHNVNSHHLHTNVYQLFVNFPIHFQHALDRLNALSPKQRAPKLNACLQMENEPGLETVAKQLIPLLQLQRWCPVPTASKQPAKRLPEKPQSASKVACAASLFTVIDREVPSLGYIRRAEAANRLGISDKVHLNDFINEGLLTLYQFHKSQYYLCEKEFETFLETIRGSYEVGCKGKNMYDMLKQFKPYKLKLVELVKWIVLGEIKPKCPHKEGTFTDAIFSEEEQETCHLLLLRRRRNQKGYTKDEARRILNVDYHTLLKLEDAGILQPSEELFYTSGKRRISYYDPATVEQVKQRYLSINEACSKYDLSKSMIQGWFKAGKLHDAFQGLTKKYIIDSHELEIHLAYQDLS
ncbi:hypothetical protein GC101_34060 [Paenibacillus sp. LMG 31459]|uniref:TniQ domain-containing protein n=1 Tax=Paenibacillus phytohabitans TaxID=2654978 RepID=A0ABX1YVK2_9BACL|nr:TniQ family protein [Paenibacillus phytohabitans]NOU83881.1 hypothetical protein [Paenibacillus phytohabitans]